MTDQAPFMCGDRVEYIGQEDSDYRRVNACDEGTFIDYYYNSEGKFIAVVSWDSLEISKKGHNGTNVDSQLLGSMNRAAMSCWNVRAEDIRKLPSKPLGKYIDELDSILDEQDRYRETING